MPRIASAARFATRKRPSGSKPRTPADSRSSSATSHARWRSVSCALFCARARKLDLARHLPERIDEEAELVVARDRQRRVVTAGADRPRRRDQPAYRRDETPRDAERREQDHQHREQQREREDQRERQLQRAAQELQALEIEARVLDASRQLLQARRQRIKALQEAPARGHVAADRHRDAQHQLVADRLGRRVTAVALHAHLHRRVGPRRIEVARIGARRRDDAAVSVEHRDLRSTDLDDALDERALQLVGRRVGELRRERNALLLGRAQALVHDDAADLERVVERGFELDVEPVVDRRVEEAECESVDHDHRRHREQHEHQQEAPAEPGARRAAFEIDAKPPQALRDRDGEQRQRDGGGREDPAVVLRGAAAAGSVFGELERGEQQREHGERRQRAPERELQPALACHVYSAEESCHAGSNSAGRRSAPGSEAVSSSMPIRTAVSRCSVANADGSGSRIALSDAKRLPGVAKLRTSMGASRSRS
jgi:hypothetical protein